MEASEAEKDQMGTNMHWGGGGGVSEIPLDNGNER